MIDFGFYLELILPAIFSVVLVVLIFRIFSKPLKTILFMLKGKKVRAEVIQGSIDNSGGVTKVCIPVVTYEDERGAHVLLLCNDDFTSAAAFRPSAGDNITVFADKADEYFTTVHFLLYRLVTAVLLAAMPAALLIGTAGMLIEQLDTYGFLHKWFGI
ncbi:MAG: hypothetical protein ACI4KG_08825 [Oscillospiraceae bacterium]